MCTNRRAAEPRRSLALLALLASLGAAPHRAAGQEVVLPFDSEYPPLSYLQADGTPDGFDIAVARALSEKLGASPEFAAADFVRIQSGAWPEEWSFAVASMSITDRRREVFDFVGAYYYDFVVLIGAETEEGPLPAPGPGDRIGVCRGCVYRAFLEGNYMAADGEMGQPRYPEAEIVEFTTDTDMLRELSGEDPSITHGVTSARFAEYFRKQGFAIAVSADTIFVTPTYIAVPKGSPLGVAEVEAAYDEIKAEGLLADLSVLHLGRDYTDPAHFGEAAPPE
ncbi:amino acid ABC transporter substrate-binding protein, PAAT family [Roseivivax lentus]|uniref:Amino acid ABC transporter substrate-binding protein, PAAT family n=1 Tax=Roseivivax lentus TaxID=633194 RepID=A0A1N7PVM6_9RHOB|nr:transporter substrate-binding domain-containing protein [Roseivivax lentus]SIT14646.1 amino acid ABC transporter substrate-binding protein, PAAT family [Roseivivax lentus]